MKFKYSVDSHNRLHIKSPKLKASLKPNGAFQINKNNQLEYWLNEPQSWRRVSGLPRKIVFNGKWELSPNHDLELILNKTLSQADQERLTLRGKIISVENNSLAFEIISQRDGPIAALQSFRILKLTGTWQADEYNRIVFQVEKKALPDELIFKLNWQINKNQQIEYAYEKVVLAKKTKINQILTFEGFWKIDSSHKLVYILSETLNSGFDFRVQLESPSIYPQDKSIKYRLGMGMRQPKGPACKIITLYGEWKFNRNLGLVFRMDYGNNNVQETEFGAQVTLERNKFLFSLKNDMGKPLGITLTYSFGLLNSLEPQAFIRLKSCQKELGVEAGFSLPF